MLQTAILIVMVIVALAIIGLILIQQGKGADMGASFGSGASNTVFGSAGSGNFLSHATAILAAVFFTCCLVLAWFSNHSGNRAGSIDFSSPETEVQLKEIPAPSDVPAVPAAPSGAGDVPAAPVTVEVPVATESAPGAASSATQAAEPAAGATPAQEEKSQ